MGRRTLLLVAALLLAAIGTGVLFLFLRATATSTGGTTTSSGTTRVVAPTVDVPAGTKIDASVPFTFVTVGSDAATAAKMYTDAKALLGKVATQPLMHFSPVTAGQFAGAVTESSDLTIGRGKMALTIELSDPNRVGTFLRKGVQVAIFVVDADQGGGGKTHEARLILPQVTVLTTGSSGTVRPLATSTAATGSGTTRGSQALVTLEVTQLQAGQILVAQASGELYFTLLGPGASPTTKSYDQTDIAVG